MSNSQKWTHGSAAKASDTIKKKAWGVTALAGKSPVEARAGAAWAGLAAPGGRGFNSRPMVRGGDGGGGKVHVTGPGRGTLHLTAAHRILARLARIQYHKMPMLCPIVGAPLGWKHGEEKMRQPRPL